MEGILELNPAVLCNKWILKYFVGTLSKLAK